jgi:hypothetical protein
MFMDGLTIVIFISLFVTIVIPPCAIFWLYWTDRHKSKFLYFDTTDTARFQSIEATNGHVVIDEGKTKRRFDIDRTKPKILHTFFGQKPLYFIRWNSSVPFEFDIKDGKLKKGEVSPATHGEIMKSTIIEKLMNPKSKGGEIVLYILIGAVIGVLLGVIIGKIVMK